MANAMLDARQEGDSYRRIEVITGQRRRRRWTARGEGPDRSGELRGGRQHFRGGAAQWRCPWAAHGVATASLRRRQARKAPELRADPDWCRERWRDNWRAGPRCAGADEAAGDGLAAGQAGGVIEIEVSGARIRVEPGVELTTLSTVLSALRGGR